MYNINDIDKTRLSISNEQVAQVRPTLWVLSMSASYLLICFSAGVIMSSFTCQSCNALFPSILAFTGHLKLRHGITSKEYYDMYLKSSAEGLCTRCGLPTRYYTITSGYGKYCSVKCAGRDQVGALVALNTGSKHSKQSCLRRSASLMKHPVTAETRVKIGVANKGKVRSREIRKQLSESHKGKSSGAKGRTQTEAEKQQRRKSAIAYAETCCSEQGLPFPFKGKLEVVFIGAIQAVCPYSIDLDYRPCGYILDGFIHELNLAIEFDETWHTRPCEQERDSTRQANIEAGIGCTFWRVAEERWLTDSEAVLAEFDAIIKEKESFDVISASQTANV